METNINQAANEQVPDSYPFTIQKLLCLCWSEKFIDCFNVKADYSNDPDGNIILERKEKTGEPNIILTKETVNLITLYQSCLSRGAFQSFFTNEFIADASKTTIKIRNRLAMLIPEFAIQELESYLLGEVQ